MPVPQGMFLLPSIAARDLFFNLGPAERQHGSHATVWKSEMYGAESGEKVPPKTVKTVEDSEDVCRRRGQSKTVETAKAIEDTAGSEDDQ